jgi:hypothetical protein
MDERKYEVLVGDTVVASNITITTATLLVKALLEAIEDKDPQVVSVRDMSLTDTPVISYAVTSADDGPIFTPAEVASMTDAETKKHYRSILRSMKYWSFNK